MKAAIFDLDDTLVDSFPLHTRAWAPVLERHGIVLADLDRSRYMGRRVIDICRMTVEDFNLDVDPQQLFDERMAEFLAMVREELELAPGAARAVAACKSAGMKVALATSGTQEYIDLVLERLDLQFDAIITGDDVSVGKPHPEPFLAAAERLGEEPADCVVFEDAQLGVESAKSAGCFCIGVRNPRHVADLSQADLVIDSLAEFSPAMLEHGYAREEIAFPSAGVTLSGVLSVPSGARTCVVHCHGFGGNKEGSSTIMQAALNDRRIATFRFDFFGHGASGGEFADITPSIGAQNARDAFALMRERFLYTGISGASFGGYAAYHVAVADGPAFAVLRCPVTDWREKGMSRGIEGTLEEWKERGWAIYYGRRLNYTFQEDSERASLYGTLSQIACPCLIVHGDADTVVPIGQSKKAAALIEDCTLVVIPGADHRFTDRFEPMLAAIIDFIEVYA